MLTGCHSGLLKLSYEDKAGRYPLLSCAFQIVKIGYRHTVSDAAPKCFKTLSVENPLILRHWAEPKSFETLKARSRYFTD